jgi:glycosyltransferase involved in cell wall biosynthesis
MKVYLITPWLLNYPPTTGGETLIWTTAHALKDLNHSVFMFTYDTTKEFEGDIEGINIIAIKTEPKFSFIHRPWLLPLYFSSMIKPLRGIANLLISQSIYYDRLFNIYLDRIDCDIIQLEFVGVMPPYKQILRIKKKKNIPVIVHLHDIFSLYMIDEGFNTLIDKSIIKQLFIYEISSLKEVDLVITVSKRDEKLLRAYGLRNVKTVIPTISPKILHHKKTYVHAEEFKPFILVPVVHRDKYRVLKLTYELASSLNDINFIVTGTNAQEFINLFGNIKIPNNLKIIGNLPYYYLNDLYSKCLAVFAPVISRTGTLMRIIEASLNNKIVITTKEGVNSIEGLHYEGVLIGESTASFKNIIVNLSHHDYKIKKIDPVLLYDRMINELNEIYKYLIVNK